MGPCPPAFGGASELASFRSHKVYHMKKVRIEIIKMERITTMKRSLCENPTMSDVGSSMFCESLAESGCP